MSAPVVSPPGRELLAPDAAGASTPAAAPVAEEIRARLERATPLLIGAVILILGMLLIDGLPVGTVHDDGMYVILAKSLATGRGFRWLLVPGAPPATHFPPGYPAVLALVWKLIPRFPQNVIAFKALNAVFLAAVAALMVVFARRRFGFSNVGAAALALCGAAAIPMLTLSTLVMSETMFLMLLLALLLAGERIVEQGTSSPAALVLLGAAAGALTLVRSHGIVLVGALGLVLLLRRRWRDAVIVGASAVLAMLPWQLWVRNSGGYVPPAMRGNYESYTAWLIRGYHTHGFGLLPRTIERTGASLAGMVATFTVSGFPRGLALPILALVLLLLALGSWRLARRAPVTAVFLAGYVAIVLAWPFNPQRFIWGIWPLVLAVPVLGATVLVEWRPTIRALATTRALLLAGVAIAAFGHARYNVRGYRGTWWSSIPRAGAANIAPLIAWVRTRTNPSEVVMSNAEPMVYLYSGRASLPATSFTVEQFFRPVSVAESAAALRDIMHAYHVDAIAVAPADSLMAAEQAMALEHPPELVPRDTFAYGVAYSPSHP